MIPENPNSTANEVLRLFLETPLQENCAKFSGLLIEKHAIPVIVKCLRAKFHESAGNGFHLSEEDFEDLSGESCLKLLKKLSALRNSADEKPIRDFENYAAVVAYNCFNEFFGKYAPHWKSLKNQIRYAVSKSVEFEIWREKDECFCGLVKNGRKTRRISSEDLINRVEEEFADFRKADLTDLLFEILERAKSAVLLNELVSVAAKLRAFEDLPNVLLEEFVGNVSAKHTRGNDLEMKFDLAQIWREISELPTNQRVALLYNLRDERGCEMLFVFFNAKIAPLKEISEAMNLTAKRVSDLRQIARRSLKRRLEGKLKRNKPPNKAILTAENKNNGNNLDPAFGEN